MGEARSAGGMCDVHVSLLHALPYLRRCEDTQEHMQGSSFGNTAQCNALQTEWVVATGKPPATHHNENFNRRNVLVQPGAAHGRCRGPAGVDARVNNKNQEKNSSTGISKVGRCGSARLLTPGPVPHAGTACRWQLPTQGALAAKQTATCVQARAVPDTAAYAPCDLCCCCLMISACRSRQWIAAVL